MLYNAVDVAKYCITRCSEIQKPVSNLKLQKLLYFAWVEYYRATGKYLFSDAICAWQLGPVVPAVYYEYCPYGGLPINVQYTDIDNDFQNEDRERLDKTIYDYKDVSVSELVNRTHRPGHAWDCVYRNGYGNRKTIPFSLIIEKDCVEEAYADWRKTSQAGITQ